MNVKLQETKQTCLVWKGVPCLRKANAACQEDDDGSLRIQAWLASTELGFLAGIEFNFKSILGKSVSPSVS